VSCSSKSRTAVSSSFCRSLGTRGHSPTSFAGPGATVHASAADVADEKAGTGEEEDGAAITVANASGVEADAPVVARAAAAS
jgi:hypothetical protein